MGTEEILEMYHRNRAFYRNGGITATGGEPLAAAVLSDFSVSGGEKQGIHTCLDTSGITFQQEKEADYLPLAASTDLVLLDIKHGDEKAHQSLTGRSGQPVWDFLAFLDRHQIPVRIRHVLVPGLTDGRENLKLLGRRLRPYTQPAGPGNPALSPDGGEKIRRAGMDYALKGLRAVTGRDGEGQAVGGGRVRGVKHVFSFQGAVIHPGRKSQSCNGSGNCRSASVRAGTGDGAGLCSRNRYTIDFSC